jgi:RNA polymerase sigma factor (TIGR02999 family)
MRSNLFFGRICTVVKNLDSGDITGMLAAWNDGQAGALDRLVDQMYPELRQIARQHLKRLRPGGTLESAALANEAYLELLRSGGIRCNARAHFLALCSQIIRRILIDHARRRGFAKRGGDMIQVSLDEALLASESRGVEVVALDEALETLARIDPRKSRVVELRYFGGMKIEETADVLGISLDTAKRDWRMAKAWLMAQLSERQEIARDPIQGAESG